MASNDTYLAADIPKVNDAQRKAGITVQANVGAQTWNTLIGVGSILPDIAGAHISPLAAAPWSMPRLEAPDGSDLGANPVFNAKRLNIGKLVEYGTNVDLWEAHQSAQREIDIRLRDDPMYIGSATLSGDPEEGWRGEIRAGQNLFVRYLAAPDGTEWTDFSEQGVLLHISQARITPFDDVELELSFLAYDMTTLAALKKRIRDSADPAIRGVTLRASSMTQDAIIPWDCESGAGTIPIHDIEGGHWDVVSVPSTSLVNP
jgi:hypothetical protein